VASLGTVACSDDTSPAVEERSLVLLFTSDEHSHLFAFSPERDDYPAATLPGSGALLGGIARRAVVLERERNAARARGKGTLVASAGDNQMGALPHIAFESASIDYGMMEALGYDITTIGNHELDFGPAALGRSISAAAAGAGLPPIVATNLKLSADSTGDDALAAHFSEDPTDGAPIHRSRILTTENGLRVGFIGYVGANAGSVAARKAPVQFSAVGIAPEDEGDPAVVLPQLYADLQPVVDTLRNEEQVDLVIALGHAGIADTASEESRQAGEDAQVAAHVAGIDIILSGHMHQDDVEPIVVKNEATERDVLVLNAGAEGKVVGRVELTVPADPTRPLSWNPATQALLPIDDTITPDPDVAAKLEDAMAEIESSAGPDGTPVLEGLLSRALGMPIADDKTKAGDLYFYPISKTSFDVEDTRSLLYLSSDSMLAATDALGMRTDVAIESAGVVRSALRKGKTGVISAADAFNVVPLGSSPENSSIGYPLVRAYLWLLELRGVFELSLVLGPSNEDFNIGPAGIQIEYDPSRPPVTSALDLFDPMKGQVMRILLDTDHSDGFEQFDSVIYDRENGIGNPTALYSVMTSSYVAQFAASVGASLKDELGQPIGIGEAMLHREDGFEVKQVEAFMGYLAASPGGTLPSLYDVSSAAATKRLVCIAGCP
jgi:2',3'-cyclic-nucleotide 2'-phosphodiesterase (5'-nucleotidase family)